MLHTNTFGAAAAAVVVFIVDFGILPFKHTFKWHLIISIWKIQSVFWNWTFIIVWRKIWKNEKRIRSFLSLSLFHSPLNVSQIYNTQNMFHSCKMSKLGNKFQNKLEKLYNTKKIYVYIIIFVWMKKPRRKSTEKRKRKRLPYMYDI